MQRRRHPALFVLLMAIGSLLLPAATSAEDADLYRALGERAGIEDTVRDLLQRIVRDDRINAQFKGIDVQRFHSNLSDQLCEISGGPCTYGGDDMRSAHAGMGVSDTQFNALVEHLIQAMEKEGVPTWAQNRLLAELAPMHGDIVNIPAEPLRSPGERQD